MTFVPSIPLGSYAGWAYLKRTLASQTQAFNASREQKNDEEYFRANISAINTAEELVDDRRLLKVALGAFSLDGDIDSKFFIRKVLQDGTLTPGALANKLADKQYLKFSAAFGFGDFATPRNKLSDFADKIIASYRARGFERAVGDQYPDLRYALNVARELPGIASKNSSDDSKWFNVLGNAPLRQVFEKALGLPSSVGRLDLDKQLEMFKMKARSQFGDDRIEQFLDPDKIETLNKRFLLRSQAESFSLSIENNSAVQLMQQIVTNDRNRII